MKGTVEVGSVLRTDKYAHGATRRLALVFCPCLAACVNDVFTEPQLLHLLRLGHRVSLGVVPAEMHKGAPKGHAYVHIATADKQTHSVSPCQPRTVGKTTTHLLYWSSSCTYFARMLSIVSSCT